MVDRKNIFIGDIYDVKSPLDGVRDKIAGKFLRLAETSGFLDIDDSIASRSPTEAALVIAAEHWHELEEYLETHSELQDSNERLINLIRREAQTGQDIEGINNLVKYYLQRMLEQRNDKLRLQ